MKIERGQDLFNILCFILSIAIFAGIILFGISGCQSGNIYPDIVPTPKQMLFKTVTKTNWLVTLSILGIGAGAFSFFNGSLKGIKFAAACLVVLAITLMLARYATWIAFIAMAASVALPVLTIYINRRALKQIVTGVQNVKKEVLGITGKRVNEALAKVQAPETQAIVKTIKDRDEKNKSS